MNYILKRNRRSKHIRIRVDEAGQVIVTAPYYLPKVFITRFLSKSSPWIKRQQQKLELKKLAHPVLDWDQNLVSYKGKYYYIKFEPKSSQKVRLGNKYIYVSPVTQLEEDISQTLLMWLKNQSQIYLHQSLEKWSSQMGIKYNQVRFRQQRSRWGSCSSSGNLNFNWRLIHFHPDVIDYVVIHELAHITHHNHSKNFWNLVSSFDPLYKKRVNFLKQQHLKIEKLT